MIKQILEAANNVSHALGGMADFKLQFNPYTSIWSVSVSWSSNCQMTRCGEDLDQAFESLLVDLLLFKTVAI
jgi:hypothetical protein